MSVNITSSSAEYITPDLELYVELGDSGKVYYENRKTHEMFLLDSSTSQFRRSNDTGYFGSAWSFGYPFVYMFTSEEEAIEVVEKIKAVMKD